MIRFWFLKIRNIRYHPFEIKCIVFSMIAMLVNLNLDINTCAKH